MKYFLIKYQLVPDAETDWSNVVSTFVAEIEGDPELKHAMSYRSFKGTNGEYYHLATAVDETAAAILNQRDFFERYTATVEKASGGSVEVTLLELVAETNLRL